MADIYHDQGQDIYRPTFTLDRIRDYGLGDDSSSVRRMRLRVMPLADADEITALPKKTAHIPFIDMGHLYSAHIPVVDLPEEIMKDVPEAEKWRGLDVHLQHQMVILCLN